MQYLTNWRMQCGARLLRKGYLSAAAVAREGGYDSEGAFSRAFKRATDLPRAPGGGGSCSRGKQSFPGVGSALGIPIATLMQELEDSHPYLGLNSSIGNLSVDYP